jgi:hypothetical protein
MSYDNDLDRYGKPILDRIKKGCTSPNQVVAVQADFTDSQGMMRYTIRSTGTKETKIHTEDSAREDTALAYFEWFTKSFRCKRYVFTFLDHGGRIDEMCNDNSPGPSGSHWMSGKVMGKRLRGLRQKLGDKLQLLFLQQCGRGSLENLYSFRGTADYIMSSPVSVGAPNTYYTKLHEWLPKHPDATGAEVASKIADWDEDYTIYTCLRSSKLEELPNRVDGMLKPLLETEGLKGGRRQRVIYADGEPIVDARAYFDGLAQANSSARAASAVASFFDWTRKELFTYVRPKNADDPAASALCGLSVFAPSTPREAKRYEFLGLQAHATSGPLEGARIA